MSRVTTGKCDKLSMADRASLECTGTGGSSSDQLVAVVAVALAQCEVARSRPDVSLLPQALVLDGHGCNADVQSSLTSD